MHTQISTSRNHIRYWRLNDNRRLCWIGDGPTPCYYCGDPATGVDHVLPLSRLVGLDPEALLNLPIFDADTVPCCPHCNTLLRDSVQDSLAERKQELKVRLRRRWKALLDDTPDWTEDQLDDLSEGYFKDSLIAQLAYREHILARLRW